MKVAQIFYGRGKSGYAVLGVSTSASGCEVAVQELCQSVGTPGYERKDDDKPFLLQKTVGRNVIMVCGRNGELDSVGRRTMFFHALIVSHAYALEKQISAYDLYCAGVFSGTCLSGSLEDAELPGIASATSAPATGLAVPSVVKCRRAENLKLIDMFQGRLVGHDWATISWSPLGDFDFYGIDESRSISNVPGEYQVYDVDGVLIRDRIEKTPGADNKSPIVKREQKKGGDMKSMVFGIVGVVLGVIVGRMSVDEPQQEVVDAEKITAEIELKVKSELGSKMKDEAIALLRPELEKNIRTQMEKEYAAKTASKPNVEFPVFDEQYRIVDFREQMKKIDTTWESAMIENKGDPTLRAARDGFKRIQRYVEFVNRNFPIKN